MTKANDLASLLDANGDVVSSALDNVPAAPTPSLSSLGIPNHDDITVDGSGNLGLGGSPSRKLHIIDSGDTYVAVQGGTSSKAGIFFGDSDNHTLSRIRHDNTDNSLQFSTNEIERMRISGGNLLVGKTSIGLSTTGIDLRSNGLLQAIRDGGTVVELNRQTSDGTIIDLRKDNTTVGSIGGSVGSYGYMHLGSGATGLQFTNAFNQVIPYNPSSLSARDNTIDLGSSITRFKDLYLSGGVYLGGTGSANHLDDYEEGTWTPTAVQGVTGFTVASAGYTKVGRLVTVNFYLNSFTGGDANRLEIGGLPFTSKSATYYTAIFEANDEPNAQARIGTNAAKILFWNVGSDTRASYTGNTLASHLIGSITYEAA